MKTPGAGAFLLPVGEEGDLSTCLTGQRVVSQPQLNRVKRSSRLMSLIIALCPLLKTGRMDSNKSREMQSMNRSDESVTKAPP